VEEYNRGSAENPMTYEEIRAKFDDNSSGFLPAAARARIVEEIQRLELLPDAKLLVELATTEEYCRKT
jgi:hypothetical protein